MDQHTDVFFNLDYQNGLSLVMPLDQGILQQNNVTQIENGKKISLN